MTDSTLKVGFARVDVTPPLGVNITGYFKTRIADGVLDNLEINAVAVNKGKNTVLICSIDNLHLLQNYCDKCRQAISNATGIDFNAIFIHSTHSHTAPLLGINKVKEDGTNSLNDAEITYSDMVIRKFADVALFAINDLTPAKMGYAITKAENIGFNRRYLMKDGSVKTNPGVNNPDIVKSIGLLDERLNVVRFEREDGLNIVIGNYGNHPDTIGGNKISGDWPAFTRRIFEKAIDNTRCVFLNGAQGDINHVNVRPVGGDLNGMFMDFDDVSRGYAHAKHMGNVVAGAMMGVYEKVNFVDVSEVKFLTRTVDIPSNMPNPEDMEMARYINKLHLEGKDSELPYKGMMLTTKVAEAGRMLRLEHGPEAFPMPFIAIAIGKVALFGIPGEPFTGIGMGIKEAKGWDMIMPCCLTNASIGYFPMKDSYDEGGYEAQSSSFKAGVAERIIEIGVDMLNELNK